MTTSANVSTNLVFRHIFGISNTTNDNIAYLDDSKVAYVAAHSLVVYDATENRQQILQGSEITETITAMTIGFTKKHAAIAEKGDRPKIHVFDIATSRLKKTLIVVDIKGKEINCLQFSDDDQMVLSLSGFPDFSLMCWNWMKGKLVASMQVSLGAQITRCSLNPLNAKDPLACVSGKDSIKFYRISDRSMRLLKDNTMEGFQFTCHFWLREFTTHDFVVACTENGDLIVFCSGEYLCRLECSPGPSFPISYVLPTSSGFIIGSKLGGIQIVQAVLSNFYVKNVWGRKSDSKEDDDRAKIDPVAFSAQFTVVNQLKSELSTGGVTGIAINVSETQLTVLHSDNQLVTLPADALSTATASQFKYLSCSFHEPKTILGQDVCVKKPFVVTCSTDGTLRLWDFVANNLVIQRRFVEEMLSVTLHPTGLHCVIGFIDRLSIFHILVDDLKLCLELPIKNCRECRYNKGGNLIAAVNGNSIFIYDFYTGTKIADLKGHNGKVRALHWLDSGYELLSCGQDGAIYLWDIHENKRTGEFLKKGVMYTSVVHTGTNGSIFGVGSDRLMKELSSTDLSWIKDIDSGGFVLNQLAICLTKKSLLVSTSEPGKPGCIRVYNYPVLDLEYTEYIVGSAITRLSLTPDENFAVVSDESGCVSIYEIHDRPSKSMLPSTQRRAGAEANYSDLIVVDNWSDEVLIPRNDLEERAHIIQDLKMKLREQKFQNDFKLKLKETEYAEHTKEETEAFVRNLEAARVKLDEVREAKSKAEQRCVDVLKQQNDKFQADIQQCETSFQSDLMSKVGEHHELMRKREEQKEFLDTQRQKLRLAYERVMTELIRESESSFHETVQTRLAAEKERADLIRNGSEMETQLEDDIDTEIEYMSKNYTNKLLISRENSMKYKGQLGINKKKCIVIQKEMKDLREITVQLYDKERELHEQIIALEKEISIHKKEIKSRDVSIGEKEKRVYELKKKNQELDKFKFVLDFKIRELKQQIEPRQKEINEMKTKIKEMDKSLEKYHSSNSVLDESIGNLRLKIDDLQNNIKRSRMLAKKYENSMICFRTDINQSVAYILVPEKLKEAVIYILKTYTNSSEIQHKIEEDVEGEFHRHKDFLQKSVSQIKTALVEEVNARLVTNNKLMHDNMGIINDINKQRNANRLLKNSIQADVGRMRHVAAKKKQRKGSTKKLPKLVIESMSAFTEETTRTREVDDPALLAERNKARIVAIRQAIANLETSSVQRSYSREVLPPLDTFEATVEKPPSGETGSKN